MFKTRIGILSIFLAVGFLTVIGRLGQLQVLRYEKYAALSGRDSGKQTLQSAARAEIRLPDGSVLAEDRPFFDIAVRVDRLKLERVTLDEVKKDRESATSLEDRKARADRMVARLANEPFVQALATTLKYDRDELARGVFTALDNVVRTPQWASPSSVQIIARGVDEDVWLSLKAAHEDGFHNGAQMFGKDAAKLANVPEPPFPGLVCTVSTRRIYPRGSFASFVVGTNNDMNEQEEDQLRQFGVLLESFQSRAADWTRTRNALDAARAAQLGEILRDDPREIDNLGQLYGLLSNLKPNEREAVARLGMGEQLKWIQRPPRVRLNDSETLWLGVGLPLSASHNSLFVRTIGEAGVERYYNDLLRGKHTLKFLDTEFKDIGLPVSFQNPADAREDKPLTLTLNTAWQEAAENALQTQELRGAIVVIDANTGAVLAMTSNPGFDPNVFTPPRTGAKRQEQLLALSTDPNKPMINRAIDGEYALGSIMKSLVMAVALERGQLTTEETFQCPGFIKEGGQIFHCDGGHAHGTVDVYKCLRCSCNVMAHQVGARVGVEAMAPYAKLFFGKKTGIDLPFEKTGVYPDRAYRLMSTPKGQPVRPWTRGNDYMLAIGQGEFNATVIQAAVLIAAIGNGGHVVTPHVNADAVVPPPVSMGIGERSLDIVRKGLDECVNVGTPGARGTCYTPFHSNGELPVRVAGKTSSAEHKKGAKPHAWFAGYLPADKPQVAFVVMLEEAGHGGECAGPMAYKMLREIYGTKASPNPNPGATKKVVAEN